MNRGRGRGFGYGGEGGRAYWSIRGRSSRSGVSSSHLHGHIGDDHQIDSDSFGSKKANFHRRRQIWEQKSPGRSEKYGHEHTVAIMECSNRQKYGPESVSSNTEELDSLFASCSVSMDTSSITESGSKDR